MSAAGVRAAEPLGPSSAPAQSAGEEDADDDEPVDTGLRLAVDRLVLLDMAEGSWVCLDVRPDGQTSVFDFLGDLFTIPIAGAWVMPADGSDPVEIRAASGAREVADTPVTREQGRHGQFTRRPR